MDINLLNDDDILDFINLLDTEQNQVDSSKAKKRKVTEAKIKVVRKRKKQENTTADMYIKSLKLGKEFYNRALTLHLQYISNERDRIDVAYRQDIVFTTYNDIMHELTLLDKDLLQIPSNTSSIKYNVLKFVKTATNSVIIGFNVTNYFGENQFITVLELNKTQITLLNIFFMSSLYFIYQYIATYFVTKSSDYKTLKLVNRKDDIYMDWVAVKQDKEKEEIINKINANVDEIYEYLINKIK